MQRLAMHRDQDFRLDPADQFLELGAARMAGDVHQMGAVGDHLDALVDQAVEHAADGLLVAGDGARRDDDAVAARQSVTSGCWSSAMRESAARGSPWLPVHSATTLFGGR